MMLGMPQVHAPTHHRTQGLKHQHELDELDKVFHHVEEEHLKAFQDHHRDPIKTHYSVDASGKINHVTVDEEMDFKKAPPMGAAHHDAWQHLNEHEEPSVEERAELAAVEKMEHERIIEAPVVENTLTSLDDQLWEDHKPQTYDISKDTEKLDLEKKEWEEGKKNKRKNRLALALGVVALAVLFAAVVIKLLPMHEIFGKTKKHAMRLKRQASIDPQPWHPSDSRYGAPAPRSPFISIHHCLGTLGLPIVGETPQAIADRYGFLEKRIKQYGKVFKSHVFGAKTVYICDEDLIKKVVNADPPLIESALVKSALPVIGETALVNIDGPRHRYLRRMIMTGFNSKAVGSYVSSITSLSDKSLQEWANEDSVLFVREAKKFAFNVNTDCVIGMSSEKYPSSKILPIFERLLIGIISLGIDLPFTRFRQSLNARKDVLECIRERMEETRNGRTGSNGDSKLLSRLVNARDENGKGLEDAEIEDNIILLLVAGYDTTANVAFRCLNNLAKYPQVLEKAIQEQEDLEAKFGKEISSDVLEKMPYLEAVLKETMRLETPAPSGFRRATKTFELDGYKIPEGWQIMISFLGAMRFDGSGWKNTQTFDPERFLKDSGSQGQYMPFGVGVHSCVGNILAMVELRVLFSQLLRGYDFSVENPYARLTDFAITEPEDEMPVRFSKK
ncbi:hypothetical protein BSKO_03170 [Bryopsis sp. KO-2023]|nr:hypothetical protein BSKO_03170 [Bryopsis sp. KO-2023]